MSKDEVVDSLFVPIRAVAWFVAIPIQFATWVVTTIKRRTYDPEKIVCPSCGFRGDSGTNGKTCTVRFIQVQGGDGYALQHTCFRCGCDKIYTKLYYSSSRWMNPNATAIEFERLKQAAARETL